MTVVTRFAPSPTGYLHIGGARTALFNWLFTKHSGGRFHLRIEDTDRARSTEATVEAIYDGLRWLGLDWDGAPVSQFQRAPRHAEIARALLASGKAYHCYCTPAELEEMRKRAMAEGKPSRYDGRWRDRDPAEAPADIKPTIRLKAPRQGETVIRDRVQGEIVVQNAHLDDMVLLRGDGTPVYMLAVVVDDHDMQITHVIRGVDHLTNTARQLQIYHALDWPVPEFAHIPLIYGPDGAKLSKRHGALSVLDYRELGYLPAAMRNYLLRLGWSHGDDEIIATEQAIAWFALDAVGQSPARFDLAKLDSVNAHYLRHTADAELVGLVLPRLAKRLGGEPDAVAQARLLAAMPGLKERARTLVDLADSAWFCVAGRPIAVEPAAAALLQGDAPGLLAGLAEALAAEPDWREARLEAATKAFVDGKGVKLGKVAQPLRVALTGRTVSPGIYQVMAALGREETLARLADATAVAPLTAAG
ncbi:MAG: glutamate--tRNA ligase [Alphaproteobacteria bacterium]|nr:glutamate--tRNA ligase [Alphaproteobacteria bacterium]